MAKSRKEPDIGDNSGDTERMPDSDTVTVAASQMRAIIERIERLLEERQTINEDIREIYVEAKGTGFDVKTLRAIVRLRAMDQAEREEREAMLELYKAALGMA